MLVVEVMLGCVRLMMVMVVVMVMTVAGDGHVTISVRNIIIAMLAFVIVLMYKPPEQTTIK